MVITYPPVHAVFGVSPHGILAAAGIAVGAVLLFARFAAGPWTQPASSVH